MTTAEPAVEYPPLPADLVDLSMQITAMLSEPFTSDPICEFLTFLCDLEDVHRSPPPETPDPVPSQSLTASPVPDPPPSDGESIPRVVSQDRPAPRKSRQRSLDRVGPRPSSYRKLRDPFPLESDPSCHFALNRKYKIIPFGHPGSASARVFADEDGSTPRPHYLYNQDRKNNKFDEIADEDIISQIGLSLLAQGRAENRTTVLETRSNFFFSLRYNVYTTFSLPLIGEVTFRPIESTAAVNIREFRVVGAILSNVVAFLHSRPIRRVTADLFHAYGLLLRAAIDFPHRDFHFVCDSRGVICFTVTQQILAALLRALNLPQNYKFRFFQEVLDRYHFAVTSILDEIAMALIEQIDKGGPFAYEIMRFKELLWSAEVDGFIAQVREAAAVNSRQNAEKKLLEIAMVQFNWSEFYGVKFVFARNGEFRIAVHKLEEVHQAINVFPMVNMFAVLSRRIGDEGTDLGMSMPW
jgi:hypothetical protein